MVSILDALDDPALFARDFDRSWDRWRIALAAIFGLPCPSAEALDLFTRCTGRPTWPRGPAREIWALIGRRGGKSRIAALIAVYLACFRVYDRLVAGERGTVLVIAADRTQAGIVLNYVRALLDHPMLRPLVAAERAESIDLSNGITISIATASYRTIRGRTVVAAVLDEVAFWRSEEAAEPDVEILNALRPSMATVPGALLVGISTPYSRRGVAWRAFSKHYGQDSAVLVWRAPSLMMNPTLAPEAIEAARAEDPAAAAAEWDAEFRSDIEPLFGLDAVQACVVPHRIEVPPGGSARFHAFVDPSGGSADSFTLAIAHREKDGCVIDALRERRPPFSPDQVVGEFAALCRIYRVTKVIGDRYAGAWVRERFQAHRIRYEPAALSKSEYYVALLAHVNSQRVQLPDIAKLVNQLIALERRTARGTGKDSVDHPPGGHDDLANAVAGVAHLVLGKRAGPRQIGFTWGPTGGLIPVPPPSWHWGAHEYQLALARGELDD